MHSVVMGLDSKMNTKMTSSRNRKRLSALLAIVVAAALLAVYVLYGRSRHDQPNKPPESSVESSEPAPQSSAPIAPQ
jgi:cytoskeletal protein RodZ